MKPLYNYNIVYGAICSSSEKPFTAKINNLLDSFYHELSEKSDKLKHHYISELRQTDYASYQLLSKRGIIGV